MANEKAPDFSRHPNVEPEYTVAKKVIFKAKEMDAFDKAYAETKTISEDELWVGLYMKVGMFCGWSYREFQETPYHIIKAINKHIDEKMDKFDSAQDFLSWRVIETAQAISKCFGGGNS